MACDHCGADGDDVSECIYPYYGVAPHKHDLSKTGSYIGSTVVLPESEWPDNFSPDFEDPSCGIYTHCPKCGAAGSI